MGKNKQRVYHGFTAPGRSEGADEMIAILVCSVAAQGRPGREFIIICIMPECGGVSRRCRQTHRWFGPRSEPLA
jgi:hypothetical protein